MSQRQDCLDNMHANTQVPKVIGFERISELSGNEDYHMASSFFWDIVTGERSLAFGGNSRREHFPAKDACMDFINDIDGPESCNTNNILKLTEDLHRRNPEARYADYYELATPPSIRNMEATSISHLPVPATIATTPLLMKQCGVVSAPVWRTMVSTDNSSTPM